MGPCKPASAGVPGLGSPALRCTALQDAQDPPGAACPGAKGSEGGGIQPRLPRSARGSRSSNPREFGELRGLERMTRRRPQRPTSPAEVPAKAPPPAPPRPPLRLLAGEATPKPPLHLHLRRERRRGPASSRRWRWRRRRRLIPASRRPSESSGCSEPRAARTSGRTRNPRPLAFGRGKGPDAPWRLRSGKAQGRAGERTALATRLSFCACPDPDARSLLRKLGRLWMPGETRARPLEGRATWAFFYVILYILFSSLCHEEWKAEATRSPVGFERQNKGLSQDEQQRMIQLRTFFQLAATVSFHKGFYVTLWCHFSTLIQCSFQCSHLILWEVNCPSL